MVIPNERAPHSLSSWRENPGKQRCRGPLFPVITTGVISVPLPRKAATCDRPAHALGGSCPSEPRQKRPGRRHGRWWRYECTDSIPHPCVSYSTRYASTSPGASTRPPWHFVAALRAEPPTWAIDRLATIVKHTF